MMNVFAQSLRLRRRGCQFLLSSALILPGAALMPGTAWAACTPDSTGKIITCDGNSPTYTNNGTSLQVTADGTSVIVAPLVIGSGTATAPTTLTVASGGTIEGANAVPSVQFGDYANITNNGTITSSASTSGAAGIQVGINSTVTNNGTLTAAAGTPAVSFVAAPDVSTNGTFTNGATAPAAVTGNIIFGYNIGTNVGTLYNAFNTTTTATSTATYGLDGNVTGQGNMKIDNEGQWTGALVQTTVASAGTTVSFTNGASANFTGTINTEDQTTLVNNATGLNPASVGYAMLLGNGSALGTATTGSSLTNNGVLTIGSTVAPGLVTVNGNFVQSSTGTLNMAVAATGTVVAGASAQPYSQIYAVGGTATLGGILNVNTVSGFFPVGSKYDLIVADKGITGSFSQVNVLNASGVILPFITFGTAGTIVPGTTAGQEYYEFTVSRIGNYAKDIASVATPNQLAVASALGGGVSAPVVNGVTTPSGLVAMANLNPTGQEATLIGQIDQLTVAQAQGLFDELSPAGLVAYANALRDEANIFERQIQLRMTDQNSDHAEDGWWGGFNTQFDLSKNSVDTSKSSLFGFSGGYDLSGPHHVFGLAGNVMFDSLHNAGSTLTGHNRDFALAGYAGYDLSLIHLTGQVQYNFGHLSTTRNLALGTIADTATGSAAEHLFKATATAGIMLKTGSYTFEPFGGIDYDNGKINSFTEQGDGAAALTVLPISVNRTDLLAGIALTKSRGKFRPYLRATFRDEIGGNNRDSLVSAYFDGNTATTFTVTGVAAAKHEGDLNAGVNWVFEDAGSLFVGYQGTIRSGYNTHGINMGIRLEF